MSYSYLVERPRLFTEDGQVLFLKVRDEAHKLLISAGAFRSQELFSKVSGDNWMFAACLDRLVELKELTALRPENSCWGQYQVYTSPQVHNY